MKELADQVLATTSKQSSKEQTEVTFVLGNSELPRTKPREIDLSRFSVDKIQRERLKMTTVRAKIHTFQRMMDSHPLYDEFIHSDLFSAVYELQLEEERVWLAGAQVPTQI